MDYKPPKTIPEVLQQIHIDEALEPSDGRYVETQTARGSEETFKILAAKFNYYPHLQQYLPLNKAHVLFFGHTGSGKTTVLRRYVRDLTGPALMFPVELDITTDLDRNNLRYSDVLMLMAKRLVEALTKAGVTLNVDAILALENWFKEHVLTRTDNKELATALETTVKGQVGIPLIASLLGRFTTAIKTNVTYKEELRTIVRNAFSQFAVTFNSFLRSAEAALQAAGKGRRVLFVVDGADKLRGDDTREFFVHDAELLLAIEVNAVYTAPLSLLYEFNLVGTLQRLVLPMVKLANRDGAKFDAGVDAMRDILLRRADRSLFASEAEISRFVEFSGGHPRELLRLLKAACEMTDYTIGDSCRSRADR